MIRVLKTHYQITTYMFIMHKKTEHNNFLINKKMLITKLTKTEICLMFL